MFFFYQFDGFADVIINGPLKGENAIISWSKGDINDFSKEENNNKMCDFDEYDSAALRSSLIYTLMESKVNSSVS